MKNYIKPPTLSTSFSESGKSAKKRFENILNTRTKKTGTLSFILVLAVVFMVALLGFNANRFVCRTFDCSFNLPKDWTNKVEVEENNNIVYVYHKAIREKYGEGTGLLFYIEMLTGDNLTHDDITEPGNRTIALQEGGFTYVFGMPTDVQYPIWEGGDKELADDYVKMTKELEKIKKSVKRETRADTKQSDEQTVRDLVEAFGKSLQKVSLQAPGEILKKSIHDNYSGCVSQNLIEKWISEPLSAPGRLTSSPWPDRIEIDGVEKTSDNEYIVSGSIIEITSSGSEPAAKQLVILAVKKDGEHWLITDVILGHK